MNGPSPAEIYSFLLQQGASPEQATGILANIKQESGFDPSAFNEGEGAYGLFQHRGDRLTGMQAQYGNSPSWQNQVSYALTEPEGKQYLASQFEDPGSASDWWMRKFERPADPDREVEWRRAHIPAITAQLQQSGAPAMASNDSSFSPPVVPGLVGGAWELPPQIGQIMQAIDGSQDKGDPLDEFMGEPLLHLGLGLLSGGSIGKGIRRGVKTYAKSRSAKDTMKLQRLQAALGIYSATKPDGGTAGMQNYQYLIQQGASPEEARKLAFGGGGVTVNTGGQQNGSPAWMQGSIPSGYERQVGPDGQAVDRPIPGGSATVPTEGERTSADYLTRMREAEAQRAAIQNPPQESDSLWLQLVTKYGPNWVRTPEGQLYRNAADQFIRAKLRKESGAAIPTDEWEAEYRTFFPQPGDAPEVMQQKAAARVAVMRSLETQGARALPDKGQGGAAPPGWSPAEMAELESLRQVQGPLNLGGGSQ